jgi:hypothetical protein
MYKYQFFQCKRIFQVSILALKIGLNQRFKANFSAWNVKFHGLK